MLFLGLILSIFLFWQPSVLASVLPRALAIIPSIDAKDDFSELFQLIKQKRIDLVIEPSSSKNLKLYSHDENLYQHVLLLCPECKKYGSGLNVESFVKFVENGGNIVFVGDSGLSRLNSRLASEFGVKFEEPDTFVADYSNSYPGSDLKNTILASNLASNKHILPGHALNPKNSLVYYKGIAHSINSKNYLVSPLVSGSPTTISIKKQSLEDLTKASPSQVLSGSNLQLVSVFQSLNNARATFIGSTDMMKNKFFHISDSLQEPGDYRNKAFIDDLLGWVFQQRGVLKYSKPVIFKTSNNVSLESYQIRDEILYSIEISEFFDGKWVPFDADDVQLEIRMLDPYIRTTLDRQTQPDSEYATFSKKIVLPDKYGVFKFLLEHRRQGITWLEVTEVIPIHPLRHNQFPRFLSQAYPYYATSFLLLSGFIIISTLWLFSPTFKQSINI
ncbi:hypothetical protein BB560_000771 [Smittium megazygosporum]|uniref:Dolichyl-diphosphooligosaccharide--protein glycosyltransferase subunit WBP1 n=1 Tax=Smittium megazygosporum TaxID=133381 RepID=A0A2T9ZJL9_9FUNG|nr:hypothetical protein BB560_000771 [Smittium megazygosporum]